MHLYLINRLPTTSLNFGTHYSIPFNKDPCFFYFLKFFGCVCFPLLQSYHSHQLNFIFDECLYLGYSQLHKGYKCLSSSGRVYISKDVLFNEHMFPYVDISPNTPISIKDLDMYLELSLTLTPRHFNFFTNYFCYT